MSDRNTRIGRGLTVSARENGSIGDHLRQNASHGPDVDGLRVSFAIQHDFRRSVPASGDILGQEAGVVMVWIRDSRQTEITDLQITRRVQQQVTRLQVTMQDVR